jgi:hypothetical protein
MFILATFFEADSSGAASDVYIAIKGAALAIYAYISLSAEASPDPIRS